MDPALDPALLAQRFGAEGQANLPPAAIQMLLQNSRGAPAFAFQQTPAQQVAQVALFSQLLNNQSLAQLQSPSESGQPDAHPNSRARSGGAAPSGAGAGGAPVSYASRHQQAEARRRSRINERLEALRKVVPHSERANTATFLEDVLKYVEHLQRRVVELEQRLGLEPTVKIGVPPRLADGGGEPSSADNLASQLQQAPRATGLGSAAQQAAAAATQARQQQQQQGGPFGAAATLEQQLGGIASRASVGGVDSGFPPPGGMYTSRGSGLSAAAGGQALPTNSEELVLEAALQKGPSAMANMAESRPTTGHALAQLAQQAHLQALAAQQAQQAGSLPGILPPLTAPHLGEVGGPGRGPVGGHLPPALLDRSTDLLTAQDLAAATAATRAGALDMPRPSSPLTSSMLQQAAQALLCNSPALGGRLSDQQQQQGQRLGPQQQQQQSLSAAAFATRDPLAAPQGGLLPGLRGQALGGFPGALMPPPQLQAQHAQQLHLLLAGPQAKQVSHAQRQPGQPLSQPLLLGGALGTAPQRLTASGHSGPPPSLSADTPTATAAVAAAAAAMGAGNKELSNSGRSQQTRHGGGGGGARQGLGPEAVGTGQLDGEKGGRKRDHQEEELSGGKPKKRHAHARPTVSV